MINIEQIDNALNLVPGQWYVYRLVCRRTDMESVTDINWLCELRNRGSGVLCRGRGSSIVLAIQNAIQKKVVLR